MHKLGLNILGDGNFLAGKATSTVQRWHSPFTLVMNNYDYAASLKPFTTVIHRHWPDDNAGHHTTPAERYHTLRHTSSFDNDVILYTQNEPKADRVSAQFDISMVRLTEADGVGCVVGNYGYGGPEDTELEGALLPLLRELAASNKRRRAAGKPLAYLGVHEYYDFHDWRFQGFWKGEYWDVDPLAGNYWLIGRFHRILWVCDKYGIEYPPILVTEHGSDSNRDEKWHGWLAGAALSQEKYAKDLLDMQRLVYNHPAIHGVLIFTWGENWDTFDIRSADRLIGLLAQEAGTMEVVVNVGLIKRDAPGGAKVGSWAAGTYGGVTYSAPVTVGGYVWREFTLAGESWFSATGPVGEPNQWVILPDTGPVEPPPSSDPDLIALEARIQGVEEAIEALQVQPNVQELEERVGALEADVAYNQGDIVLIEEGLHNVRSILYNVFGAIIAWASEARDATKP